MDKAHATPPAPVDDGIAIEAARRAADRRAIARIPVVPEGLDLEAITQAVLETDEVCA